MDRFPAKLPLTSTGGRKYHFLDNFLFTDRFYIIAGNILFQFHC